MAILKKRTLLADGDAGFDPLSERGKDSSFLSVPLTIETAAMCDMDLTHTSGTKKLVVLGEFFF